MIRSFALTVLARCMAIAGLSLLSLIVPFSAHADYTHLSAKPEYKLSDTNNVDLLTGQFSLATTDLKIGSGPGSLTHTIMGEGNILWPNSPDNYSYRIYSNGSLDVTNYLVPGGDTCTNQAGSVIVETGDSAERFCVKNGVFVSWAEHGGTLSYASGQYTYKNSDGVKYQFPVSGSNSPTIVTYPNGVVLTVYTKQAIVSSTGWQLRFGFDGSGNLSSVIAFNGSVDYCAPTAATCTFSRAWPTVHYSITNVQGQVGGTYGLIGYDVTLTDQYNRVTTAHRIPGNLAITTPESSVSGNLTYTLCDNDGVGGYTTACNANMGPYIQPFDKVGHVTASSNNGAVSTYQWVIGGVPYTTTGQSTTPLGRTRYRYSVAGCSNWDPCYNYMTTEDGQRVNYDHLHHSKISNVVYDANITDAFVFDSRNNLLQTTRTPNSSSGLSAVSTSSQYDGTCNNLVTCNKPNYTIDANGNRTDYTYDPEHGGILTIKYPPDQNGVRRETRNTYKKLYPQVKNASGALVSSSYVYMLTKTAECASSMESCAGTADEIVTQYEYNTNNLLLTSKTVMAGNADTTQPASDTNIWVTTSYGYDDVGNLIWEDGPLPGTVDKTVYRYNSLNQKIGEVGPDPDGSGPLLRKAIRTTYNAAGQVTLVETGTMSGQAELDWANFVSKSQVATSYDAYGRVAMVTTSADGATVSVTQTSYDAYGRVSCTATRMNPAIYSQLSTTDDACSLKATGIYGPDRIQRVSYDSLDHVTKVEKAVGTGNAITYFQGTYTDLGLKTSETDANNNKSTLIYDGFDRLSKLQYPSTTIGSTTSNANDYDGYGYDNNGNRTSWRRRDGQTFYYTYDALNRLVIKDVPGGTSADVYTGYDLQGHVLYNRFGSASGQGTQYWYDSLGEMTASTDMNGRTIWKGYRYHNAIATALVWPDGQGLNTDDRDALNRVKTAYFGCCGLVAYTAGYDSLGRLTSVNRQGGATSWGYDSLNRLTSMTNDLNGTTYDVGWNFTYNPASQLATSTASTTSYDYREKVSSPADNQTYDGLNRNVGLIATSNFCSSQNLPAYDLRQNLTCDSVTSRTFTYDIENHLTYGTAPGATERLVYDPEGRLSKGTADGGATWVYLLYDGTNLIGLYDTNGNMISRYVFGDGTDNPMIQMIGSGTSNMRPLYTDYHGSVIADTDSAGTLLDLYKYGPYGEPKDINNNDLWAGATQFRYTGQLVIPNIQLYYYKARFYDPKWGRFLQTDPIGSKDDLDLYAYVGDDPINHIDPTGTSTQDRLTYDEIKKKVADNNKSKQDDTLIIAAAYKESRFDTTAKAKTSTATGLLQMTKGAVKEVNRVNGTSYTHEDMKDADKNIAAASAYIQIMIDRKGDVGKGLNAFGTGAGYSDNIIKASDDLQKSPADPMATLKKDIGKW